MLNRLGHGRSGAAALLLFALATAGCAPEPAPPPGSSAAADPALRPPAAAPVAQHEAVIADEPTTPPEQQYAPGGDPGPLPSPAGPAAPGLDIPGPPGWPELPAAEAAADRGPPLRGDGRSLMLLGKLVTPGSFRRLSWSAGISFEGTTTDTPVLVAHGTSAGPVLCLTAAVHGDELNGIEIVRRVMQDVEPDRLAGTVIGIPIVNLHGFRRGSRYLPDRRDLNRYFPGNANGSAASRIARSLFDNVIRHCDALVDIHTGSLNRTNLPQLRGDLRNAKVRELTTGFGDLVVLHSPGPLGTLRRAATDVGIPAVTLEAGEPMRLEPAKVNEGVEGIMALLDAKAMLPGDTRYSIGPPVYYRSSWIRADYGGILFSVVQLGQSVQVGDVLGTVTDPITNEQNLIYSTIAGKVVGMALNQVVMPGFATFNIGIETDIPEAPRTLATGTGAAEPEVHDGETRDGEPWDEAGGDIYE
jgi:predicted deacylase